MRAIILLFCFCCFSTISQAQNIYPYCDGNFWGLVDADGKVILDPSKNQLLNIDYFVNQHRNDLSIYEQDYREGIINSKGELLTPTLSKQIWYDGNGNFFWYYDTPASWSGLHVWTVEGMKEVFYDKDFVHKYIRGENQFLIIQSRDESTKLVLNKSGKTIVRTTGQNAISTDHEKEPCPMVIVGGLSFADEPIYYDCQGNQTTREAYAAQYNPKPKEIGDLVEMVSYDEVLLSRKEVIEKFPEYSVQTVVYDKWKERLLSIIVVKDDKYGVINREGEVVLPFEYSKIRLGSEYLRLYKGDNNKGVAFKTGQLILPAEYEKILTYREVPYYFLIQKTGGIKAWADLTGKVFLPK